MAALSCQGSESLLDRWHFIKPCSTKMYEIQGFKRNPKLPPLHSLPRSWKLGKIKTVAFVGKLGSKLLTSLALHGQPCSEDWNACRGLGGRSCNKGWFVPLGTRNTTLWLLVFRGWKLPSSLPVDLALPAHSPSNFTCSKQAEIMKTVVSLRELLDVLNSEHNERKGKTGKIPSSTSKLNLWGESFIYRNSHPHCSLQWQIVCFQVWPFNHVTWKSWSSCQGAGAIWFGDPWPHGQIGISTYGLRAIDLGHGFGAQVF